MSVPGETPQDHIKIIETNIKEGISDQEIAATNDAIDFLKNNKNPETNKKAQEKINEYTSKIIESIKTFFLKENKIDTDKINKLPEALTQAYINIITWFGEKDLSDIKTALEKKQQEIKEQQEEKRLNEMLE
jgi:hypothetical protein